MTVRNVKKNLAAQQDLLPGIGPYNQTRRGSPVIVDGPAKSFIELWKYYCGAAYAGTFEDGCTVEDSTRIVVSLIDGLAYMWNGSVPIGGKPVLPMSTVASNGGLGPTTWTVLADSSIKRELGSDNGGLIVSFKPSGVAGAVKRSIGEALMDGAWSVKWFGAKGDWDMGTQAGTDDTAAVQACINHMAIAGSRRVGGAAKLYFPTGHYRLSTLTIPESLGFGIDIVSDGMNSGYLWFDHTNASPAVVGEVEFVHFRDISLMGSLSDQNGGNSALWKVTTFKGKQPSNYPDIDVRYTNCQVAFFQDFAQVYGRGCVVDNCNIGFVTNAMHIIADPATVFTPGSYFSSLETGMRHYTFRNCRFDVVSRIYKITGTGSQKDHINNILCVGNDFAQCDILIDGADATIRRANITGNSAVVSFTTGVVQVKSSASCLMVGNSWAKEFNDSVLPSAAAGCINSLWTTTGGINGLIISGNICRILRGNAVTAGAASTDVTIDSNYFPQAWTVGAGTNKFVFYSPFSCDGLHITNNSFQASTQSGSYFLFDASVQTSKNTRTANNTAPWSWADMRLRYTPRLLVAGSPTAGVASFAHGRISDITSSHVTLDVMISVDPTEVGAGDLAITLPATFPAVAENASITSSYAGGGSITSASGFGGTTQPFAPLRVNPSNQQIELWLVNGQTYTRARADLTAGAVTLFFTVRYRY